jgi:hypothetical protein
MSNYGKRPSKPQRRKFKYCVDVKLKRGRIFKRKGFLMAFNQREVKNKLNEAYPGCKHDIEASGHGTLSADHFFMGGNL